MVQSGRIWFWYGRTGAYEASVSLPPAAGRLSVAYLPDCSGLLVTGRDGRTWTVDTSTDTWVARACKTAGRNLTRAGWRQFFPTLPYRVTCPQWPAGTRARERSLPEVCEAHGRLGAAKMGPWPSRSPRTPLPTRC
jgi:hypothetical protein